jgi:hypothetical protein
MPCSDSDQSRIEWIGVLHELTRTITRNRPGHGTSNPSVIDVEFVQIARSYGLLDFVAGKAMPQLTPRGSSVLASVLTHFSGLVERKDQSC